MSPDVLPLVLAAPLLVLVAAGDFHAMRIPNWLVLAMVTLFALASLAVLDLPQIGWRFATAGIVLVVGFVTFLAGAFAGGDVKALTALALFVPTDQQSLALFGLTLSASLLIGIVSMTLLRSTLGHPGSPHASLATARGYPMGISIALAGLLFPAIHAWF